MAQQISTTGSQPAAAISPARQRITTLDVLRGFAIFGILIVNMLWFSGVRSFAINAELQWIGFGDRVVLWFIQFFAEGKFFSMFSFLFGLGFAMQMQRAETRGVRFASFFSRRMLILFLFGVAHALLLSAGDILISYALLGFVLLLFRKRSNKTLLIAAGICLLLPVLSTMASGPPPEITPETESYYGPTAQEIARIYSTGTFLEVARHRASEAIGYLFGVIFSLAYNIFAMFLLGLYAQRIGLFQNISSHLPLVRKVLWWGLGLGVVGNLVHVIETERAVLAFWPGPLGIFAFTVGAPALCLFYIAGITLLLQKTEWQKRLAPLASVGRMALTNYVLQSLICSLLFNGYGFGLYNRVSPLAGLGLTVLIFLLQIPLSVWWLRRFRFGPLEWVWRSLTYGQRQPLQPLSQSL